MLPPLAALQGSVRLARGASADAGVAQRLDAIQGSADQLSGLARSLRSFAHLGSGQAESLQRPFAPARLLEHEAQAARPAAERKGLSLTLQIASGMPEWLLGDGERLREVLQQLLANAIRFSPTGGIVLEIGRAHV